MDCMRLLLNTLQLVIISLWGITCYCICNNDNGFNVFIFWILMGFPFGFGKIRAILIPKRLGLAGELGVFALDAILAGLIGGLFLLRKIVTIILDYIKLFAK